MKNQVGRVQYVSRSNCEIGGRDPAACKARWRMVTRVPDRESDEGEFDILYCPDCMLGMTAPHPSEETIGLLYEAKATSDFDVIQHGPIDRIKDALARRLLSRLALFPREEVGAVLD